MKPHTKDYILEDSEIQKVRLSLSSFVEGLVTLGLLYTGMRVSEFVHFRREWINWKRGLIFVPRQQVCTCYECKRVLRNRKGEITKPSGVWKPKTKEAVRPIPILPEVESLFRAYFKNHNEIMDVVASRVYAWMIIKRVEKKSGVKLFPHVLRGTFATLLAAKDFDAVEITPMLGWKSFKTADEYIKLSGARVKKAVEEKWQEKQRSGVNERFGEKIHRERKQV